MRNAKALMLVLLAACGGTQGGGTTSGGGGGGDEMTEGDPVEEQDPPEEVEPPPPPPPPKPLTTEERVAVHDGCFQKFWSESPDFIDACYSDASSEETIDSGEPPNVGKEAITASTNAFWAGFTMQGETKLNLANGENVFTMALLTGTHDGEFMGMPATNKSFGMLAAEVQNLDEKGRHGQVRLYMDMATWMAQLGMAPKGAKFRPAMALTGGETTTVIASGSEAEAANVALVQSGFEAFNKHDAKALTAFYADDAVISEQWAPADTKGKKAIEKQFKELFKAFPDAKDEVGAIWGAGDYVVVETTFSGTNKAAAPGMGIKKATKKKATVRGASVFKIADGKVKEHWSFGNGMAFAIQLGLMKPPPAPKAAEPAADAPPAK